MLRRDMTKVMALESAIQSVDGYFIGLLRTDLILGTIKSTTRKSYDSEIRRLLCIRDLTAQMVTDAGGKLSAPAQGFAHPTWRVLVTLEDYITLGTSFQEWQFTVAVAALAKTQPVNFSKLRSALAMAQKCAQVQVWASGDTAIAIERGATRASTLTVVKRGTLEDHMIEDLIDTARLANPHLPMVIRIQIGGCFRIHEILQIERGDQERRQGE